MSLTQTRWNLVVSKEIDQSLREFLAHQGRAKKGELSRFVEEAVNKHIFDTALQSARANNADAPFEEIEAAAEEALAWARTRKR